MAVLRFVQTLKVNHLQLSSGTVYLKMKLFMNNNKKKAYEYIGMCVFVSVCVYTDIMYVNLRQIYHTLEVY